jgi:hypothetical protein
VEWAVWVEWVVVVEVDEGDDSIPMSHTFNTQIGSDRTAKDKLKNTEQYKQGLLVMNTNRCANK